VGDPYPNHDNVLATPLIADLPYDSGAAAEIVIVSYNYTDGGAESARGSDVRYYGVIRILNGQTCEQHASIDLSAHRVIASSVPAIGDLDGDGVPEIVAHRRHLAPDRGGVVAFKWNETSGEYELYWASSETNITTTYRWDGPSLHDLDDDGFPEVISQGEVWNGRTGARLNPGQAAPVLSHGVIPVLADVEGDGHVELVGRDVLRWNRTTTQWDTAYSNVVAGGHHFAVADFGTINEAGNAFDPTVFDGVAEVVSTGGAQMTVAALNGFVVMSAGGITGGGSPTVGDFDADGRPEVASAGGNAYRVFDVDCAAPAPPECAGTFVRWIQPSQDLSSASTGSAIFDFEGDGQAEALYADECFTRIYNGGTGEVLYSAWRTSCTWFEYPIVADPDRDSNTEILVNSNDNCATVCPQYDPIHRGIPCEDDAACLSGTCTGGLCRCGSSTECDDGYQCTTALAADATGGDVCRAYHPPGTGLSGLRVLRDRLDRWASSRTPWNQHAYSITNVTNDAASIPRTSEWQANHTDPNLNNYRQNVQGDTGFTDFPEITGALTQETVCANTGGQLTLRGTVCNRGARPVGAALPATFYRGSPVDGDVLCVSFTAGPVGIGQCLEVSCEVAGTISNETVTMVVNDDRGGGATTLECNANNNADQIYIDACIFG
jgi:hypothetical protein